jgi:hypothetical protein
MIKKQYHIEYSKDLLLKEIPEWDFLNKVEKDSRAQVFLDKLYNLIANGKTIITEKGHLKVTRIGNENSFIYKPSISLVKILKS